MVFENKKKGTRQKKELPVCTKNDVYLQTYRYSIMRKASERLFMASSICKFLSRDFLD